MIGYLSASDRVGRERAASPTPGATGGRTPTPRHYYFMGKDNIVFHTVIWPSMLLGYGEGGESARAAATLQLPDNVVASEFLTMEGKQVLAEPRRRRSTCATSSSATTPDALRYFLTAAGPETQDTDFTWAEFVRRNNDELLANWGNLVNRTLTNAHRNFGEVPAARRAHRRRPRRCSRAIEAGFDDGRRADRARRASGPRSARRCGSRREVNQYISDQAPWALVKTDRDRAGTVLYVALRCVDSLKMLFTPFLPFSSQRLHELLGYEGWLAGPLEFRDGRGRGRRHARRAHRRLRRAGSAAGQPSELPPGQKLREPEPLFKKLDATRSSTTSSSGWNGPQRVIDTHAHLDALDDAPAVLARARAAGVDRVDHGRRRRSPALPRGARARRASTTASTPRSASTRTNAGEPDADAARRAARAARARRAPSRSARPASTTSATTRRTTASSSLFEAQLELAAELGKPVVIHTRDADEDTLAVAAPAPTARVVLHCFSSPALLEPALERGWYVSFAGNVTYPKAPELREAARARPGRPHPRRDRQPVPRAAAGARAAERAGERRPHARGARRGARRGRGRARPRRSTPTRRAAFGLREPLPVAPKKRARPALPRRREHPRRHRPPRRRSRRDDVVLEIGPGLGVLTRYLAERVAHVHAVELDRSLEPHLARRLAGARTCTRLGDALALDLGGARPAADEARREPAVQHRHAARRREPRPACRSVERWCVMVQREVADRFFASPGHEGLRRGLGARRSS